MAVKKKDVASEIESILRRLVLAGSERELSPNDPLGELGLGLDSLALVGFVTALEKRFQIEFPDEIWSERKMMTLERFADYISTSGAAKSPVVQTKKPPPSTIKFERSRLNRSANLFREQGPKEFLRWAWRRFVSDHETRLILDFDLRIQKIPSYSSSMPLNLRNASLEDLEALCVFWSSFTYRTADTNQIMNEAIFRKRLESGYLCLLALHEKKIIGIDWLLKSGYFCPFTKLKFDWPPATCWAMELYEHPEYQGKGIGLALLAFSLSEAKKSGYHNQATWVLHSNKKMLTAAIQFFGYKKIGEIETTRVLNKRFSKWRIGRKIGRGGEIFLPPT